MCSRWFWIAERHEMGEEEDPEHAAAEENAEDDLLDAGILEVDVHVGVS